MLQQTPEYKRLPLHRIHGRRLSTKEFDFSAPNTPSHASTAFTKPESNASLCNAKLTQSTAHVDMYYGVPKNQQQPYNATPVELATTLWPPHRTNYWFPNWKELFHGFMVAQKGQPNQDHVADSALREGTPCIQHKRPGSSPQCSGTQSLQQIAKSQITSINNLQPPVSAQLSGCERQYLHAYTADAPFPTPIPSPDVANSSASLTCLEKDQARIGDAKKACFSPSQAPVAVSKCRLKSPLWLPQGWITEFHIRRTGTTAGTSDKYFKHLVSGRRFRTRKDVLHFISTGKCRTRKQSRGKKVLMLSTRHPLMKTFGHKKLSIPDWKPFSLSFFENKHSNHVANSLLLGHSEPRTNDDFGPLCKQSNSLCSSSSIQLPGNASTEERAHKVPAKKKAKTLSSESWEDKQASKLWQWLTKPVAKDAGTPANREVFTLSFSSPSVEKKVTEVTNQRSPKDIRLQDQTAQRTLQLSQELQAAHNGMVQMSREMQETAEKLSRQILVAQKYVECGNEMQLSNVPTATCISLAGESEADTYSRSETDALARSYVTTTFMQQASTKLPIVKNPLRETTKFPKVNSCNTIGMVPRLNDTSGILQGHLLLQAATKLPDVCSIPLPVNKPTNNTMKHPEKKMELKHAIQPAQTNLVETVPKQVVATAHVPVQSEVHTLANNNLAQQALRPEAPMVHTQNLSPATCLSSSSRIKEAERCASPYCVTMQPVHKLTDGRQTISTRVLEDNNHLEQPEKAAEANAAKAATMQTPLIVHLAPIPVISNEKVMPLNGIYRDATVKGSAVSGGEAGTLSYGTQLRSAYSEPGFEMQETDSQETVRRQLMEEIKARHLRRKKFSAVLNPKLDLSRISPSLTSRQRAKVVEKMKARNARELLAALGKQICRKAVRRKP